MFLFEWWIWISLLGGGFLFWAVASENLIGATVTILGSLLLLEFLGDISVWVYLKTNPQMVAYGALAYFPLGVLWSLFKWYLKLIDARESLREEKDKFFEKHKRVIAGGKPLTESEIQAEWDKHVESSKPQAHRYKEKILMWIAYWPCSVVWSLVSDFFRRIAKAIYNHISKYFTKMSDRIFRNV